MSENYKNAIILSLKCTELMGYNNKYSERLRRLIQEYEDLNKGLTMSRGFFWKITSKTNVLKFFNGIKSVEIGLSEETIKELINIYDQKLKSAIEEAEIIVNKLEK